LIPLPVAPLTGVTVLVTRPVPQAEALCARIRLAGGEAVAFPTIAIEELSSTPEFQATDWLIFISMNAVRYGLSRLRRDANTRIAAIGKATADALTERDVRVDAMPKERASSEALLEHPAFADVARKSVLIVKGEGGRELLQDALTQRGARVDALEVYRRVCPKPDSGVVAELERRWRDEGISVVTLTSVATLENLLALLSDSGRSLLKATPFLTLSERIAAAARNEGIAGECVLARGGDDAAIVGAIAAWHARAR